MESLAIVIVLVLLLVLAVGAYAAQRPGHAAFKPAQARRDAGLGTPQSASFRATNSCSFPIWIEGRAGALGGPIPGQAGTVSPTLQPGESVDIQIPPTGVAGTRLWAKYGCDADGRNCVTGDQMQYWPGGGCPPGGCTPPVDSLFEATWGCVPGTPGCASNPSNGQPLGPYTYFDTSQVDGYTLPYKLHVKGDTASCFDPNTGKPADITLIDGSGLDLAKCPTGDDLSMGGLYPSVTDTTLRPPKTYPLNAVDLRVISNGRVVGCMSPCKRLNYGQPHGFNQSESVDPTMMMCCPTPNPGDCQQSQGCVTPAACKAGPVASTQYVRGIHAMAPGVYAYSYDDGVGLHACPAGSVVYEMEFCPAGSPPYPQ